ncbi:MAG: 1-propanol dehydrogenase PduQ [Fusobacteriaceae bacterium]
MREYFIKPKIKSGEDSLDFLKNLTYTSYLIITDNVMVDLKIVDKILEKLPKESKIKIFKDITPNPTIEMIEAGLKEAVCFLPQCIIGLGGGSPIDASKAILYFNLKIEEELKIQREKPYFIAIPTTSGTGSEVTSYSVITKENKKIALANENMLPDLAILNSEFMKKLPSKIIAETGMDVLTHALEAYVSRISTPFTDAFAKEAIKIIKENLLIHFNNSELLIPREKVQYASCMAGIAFNNSSLGINHSIAHSIGAKFHISHGRSNAILLPYIIEINTKAWPKYKEISENLGFNPTDDENGKNLLNDFVKKLKKDFGIENSLKDFGINFEEFKNKIPEILDDINKDICTEYNPNKLGDEDYIKLLLKIYFGE